MHPTVRALHLMSADPARAAQVAAWLALHGASRAAFRDAYDLSAYVLRNFADPPDLVLFGLDALQPAERSLPERIRGTWPGVAFVFYGSERDVGEPCGGALTLHVLGDAALQAMLADTPRAVIARIRAAIAAPPAAEPALAASGNTSPPPEPPPRDADARVSVEVCAPNRQNECPEPQPAAANGGETWRVPAGEMLTPEEIEALLDDGAG